MEERARKAGKKEMRAEEDIQAKTRKKRRKKGRKGKNDVKPSRDGGQPSGRDRPQTKAKNHSRRTAPNNGSTQQKRRDTEAEEPRQSSERKKITHKEQHRTTTRADSKGRESQSEAGETLAEKRTEQRQRAGGKKMRDTEAEGEHEKTHTTIEPSRDGGQK